MNLLNSKQKTNKILILGIVIAMMWSMICNSIVFAAAPQSITGIKINGMNMESFSPDIKSYYLIMNDTMRNNPTEITADYDSSEFDVTVEYTKKSIPYEIDIKAISKINGSADTYKLKLTPNNYGGELFNEMTDIGLKSDRVKLFEGETYELEPYINPITASVKILFYDIEKGESVTVNSTGNVSALKPGISIVNISYYKADVNGNDYKTIDERVVFEVIPTWASPVNNFIINKDSENIHLGDDEEAQILYTVLPENAYDKTVIWESNNMGIARVDYSGKVKAISEGKTTIIGKTLYGDIARTINVTVGELSENTEILSVEIQPTIINLKPNVAYEFNLSNIKTTPHGLTPSLVNWSVKTGGDIVSITPNGNLTALKEGTAIVEVDVNNGRKSTVTIVVSKEEVLPESVKIIGNDEVIVGKTVGMLAEITPANSTNRNVVWHSNNPSVAAVDNFGNVTGRNVGYTEITATTENSISDRKYINVIAEPNTPTKDEDNLIKSITIKNQYAEILLEEAIKIEYELEPKGAKNTTIYFESEDEDIALVDEGGIVTGIAPGDTKIWVHNGKDVETYFYVEVLDEYKYVYVRDLYLADDGPLEMVEGESTKMTVEVEPKSSSKAKIIWETSNSKVAKVDSSGKITAVGPGEATIKASAYKTKASDSIKIKVKKYENPASLIELENTTIDMKVGEFKQLKPKISPEDSTDKKLVYSHNSKIINVNQNGGIQALDAGRVELTITTESKKVTTKVIINVTYPDKYWKKPTTIKHLSERKDFEVRFSMPIDPLSIKENVYISKDPTGNTEILDVTIKPSANRKTLIISNIQTKDEQNKTVVAKEWEHGVTYYVFIKPGLRAANGLNIGVASTYELVIR